MAIPEAERARALHRELNDAVRESEDMRILAGALAAADRPEEAEEMLREVICRAQEHSRELLIATAQRDLAHTVRRLGRVSEARAVAQEALERFGRLGAKVQVEKLQEFLSITNPE